MSETTSKIKSKGAEVKGEIKSAAGHARSDMADKGHRGTAGTTERAAHVVAKRGATASRKTEEHAEPKATGARGQVKGEMNHGHKEETKNAKKESPRVCR